MVCHLVALLQRGCLKLIILCQNRGVGFCKIWRHADVIIVVSLRGVIAMHYAHEHTLMVGASRRSVKPIKLDAVRGIIQPLQYILDKRFWKCFSKGVCYILLNAVYGHIPY